MDKKLESHIEQIEKNAKWQVGRVTQLDEHTEVADKVIELCADINLTATWCVDYWQNIQISIYSVKTIDSILPIFEYIKSKGHDFRLESERPANNRTDYDFGRIEVLLGFGEDSACKYVRTGTKKSAVYKFECPEGHKTDVKQHLESLDKEVS